MQVKDVTDAQVFAYLDEYGRGNPLEALQQKDGVPFKVALRKLERMVGMGWLQYGSSLNYVWITEEGKARLRELGIRRGFKPLPLFTLEHVEAFAEAVRKAMGLAEPPRYVGR